jgi:hypothetical protein
MNIKITSLQRSVSNGIVKIVGFEASKTTGEHTVAIQESLVLPPPTGTPIDYDNLLHSDVVEWIGSIMDLERIEASLDARIDSIANPVTATGLPWESLPEQPIAPLEEAEEEMDAEEEAEEEAEEPTETQETESDE